MPWLLRDGEVLASLEVADSFLARSRGLLGRHSFEGAMLLTHTRGVHTLGLSFPIDVAFCNKDLVVVDLVTLGRWRMSRPRLTARCVIEAEAGAFQRWGVSKGTKLEVRGHPVGGQSA
jgi:uncharacterized membrane protein (UPF0127 family)